MDVRYLLGIGLAAAVAVAACGGGSSDTLGDGSGDGSSGGDTVGTGGSSGKTGGSSGSTTSGGTTSGGTTSGGTTSGGTPTNSPTGKAFFTANVYPFLQSGCGGCHVTGPGTKWQTGDADGTYTMLFSLGYVAVDSRILLKGAHGGVTTNVLTQQQKDTFTTWVNQEIKDGGVKATPNVLEKIATCIDQTKFDAIQLGQLRTIQRTNNNNTNNVTNWAENANRCTGCNNAPCRDCHTADDATNFKMAIGYPGLAQDYTFQQTKLTNPAFLQKYFGIDPTGNPIASNAIENKSIATSKDHAYTHPYFTLTAAQKAAIQAFVDDAVTKYKAGTCTGTATPTP